MKQFIKPFNLLTGLRCDGGQAGQAEQGVDHQRHAPFLLSLHSTPLLPVDHASTGEFVLGASSLVTASFPWGRRRMLLAARLS